jgi:hypothetical protein
MPHIRTCDWRRAPLSPILPASLSPIKETAMAATATVPRSAGNGTALVVVALNAGIRLLAALEKAMPRGRRAAAPTPAKSGLRELYRLAGSSDSVSPRVADYLRDHS